MVDSRWDQPVVAYALQSPSLANESLEEEPWQMQQRQTKKLR